jgi:cell division transport system ATP-binding protein
LLDEPTGNLDPEISQVIIENLLSHAKNSNCAVVFVTHDFDLAQKTERQGQLKPSGIIWK